MLNVTKAASDYLNDRLMQSQAPADSAVRIVTRDEGAGLATTIDHERSGDQHFDCEGRTVLVLDPQVATMLSEQTLDVEADTQRLVLC